MIKRNKYKTWLCKTTILFDVQSCRKLHCIKSLNGYFLYVYASTRIRRRSINNPFCFCFHKCQFTLIDGRCLLLFINLLCVLLQNNIHLSLGNTLRSGLEIQEELCKLFEQKNVWSEKWIITNKMNRMQFELKGILLLDIKWYTY